MKTSQSYGRKQIEPVLLESLDDLTAEKVPRARTHPWPWSSPSSVSTGAVRSIPSLLEKMKNFEPIYKRWKTKNNQFERNFIQSKIILRKRTFKCEKMETLSGNESTPRWIQVRIRSPTDRLDVSPCCVNFVLKCRPFHVRSRPG